MPTTNRMKIQFDASHLMMASSCRCFAVVDSIIGAGIGSAIRGGHGCACGQPASRPEGAPADAVRGYGLPAGRSEEHTSELQSLMRISYAVFCLKKKKYKLYKTCQTTTLNTYQNQKTLNIKTHRTSVRIVLVSLSQLILQQGPRQ